VLANPFEPYVSTKPGGTGLGLAIVRRIVEELGGTIALANSPAGGARVSIRLPL
jgi:signal transduction histidine kinase